MRPARKLLLAGTIVLVAVLAALPFQGQGVDKSGREGEQVSKRRWRDSRPQAPVPLRMQLGQSPAENLTPGADDDTVGADMPVANGLAALMSSGRGMTNPPVPPRIPAAYHPLLETAGDDLREAPSGTDFENALVAADAPTPTAAQTMSRENPPQTAFRIVRHRIRDGDTLQGIAAKYLGDSDRYLEIYEMNRQRLPSAEVLPLHVEIEIPVRR